MKLTTIVQDRSFEIEIRQEDGKLEVLIDNEPIALDYEMDKTGLLSAVIINGKRYDVKCDNQIGNYKVSIWQKPFEVSFAKVESESEPKLSSKPSAHHHIIKAPMSGLVIAIHTQQNQIVKPGDALILLEAMKMQNEIRSPIAAKIRQIYTAVGKTVEKGEKLLELEPTEKELSVYSL